jgi:hypothetical protein
MSARDSPELFAACHVLHRLLAPRHPPRALCSLTPSASDQSGQRQMGNLPCHSSERQDFRDGSLYNSAKSKISIYCRNTYPVVKVQARRETGYADDASVVSPIQRSAGRWPSFGRTRISDSMAGPEPLETHSEETRASVGPTSSCHGSTWTLQFVLVGCHPPGLCGGDEETRTPDPLLAKEMLFQLSYVPPPHVGCGDGGRFWTRTRDLCLIRAVL